MNGKKRDRMGYLYEDVRVSVRREREVRPSGHTAFMLEDQCQIAGKSQQTPGFQCIIALYCTIPPTPSMKLTAIPNCDLFTSCVIISRKDVSRSTFLRPLLKLVILFGLSKILSFPALSHLNSLRWPLTK